MSLPALRMMALVVTRNRLSCLQTSLARWLAEPLDALLVIDNASDDGTSEWLATCTDPRLHVLRLPENIGGAGGFEVGLRLAAKEFDPDWIILSDDDSRPTPGALQRFLDHSPDAEWDACAAAVYTPKGEICGMNRPAMNPFWDRAAFLRTLIGGGRAGFHLSDAAFEGAPQAIHAASFVGFFLSRRGRALAGYPDGRLFIYGDDTLYTLGLTQAGGRFGFLPEVTFEHDFKSFTGPSALRLSPLWKLYYYHRNLVLLYRRCAGPLAFGPVMLIVLPKWLAKIRHYPGARLRFLQLIGLALADGLTKRLDRSHESICARAEPQMLSKSRWWRRTQIKPNTSGTSEHTNT